MLSCTIINARICQPGRGIFAGTIDLSDGRIADVRPESDAAAAPARAQEVVDAEGRLLTPGLIDMHTHGIGTYLYANGGEDIRRAAPELTRYGTTCVLPTMIPADDADTMERLKSAGEALSEITDVCIPGLHLEGPFVALSGAGCRTIDGSVEKLETFLSACQHRVKAMSISPDTPGILPVIKKLVEYGIVPMITHTQAGVEQSEAAIEAGARHATHFYDVFHLPEEREPGVRPVGCVEAVLADPRVSVDFIADGVHVEPTAIRAALAAKGYAGISLITDSQIGAGLPSGTYNTPWGFRIKVSPDDAARIADEDKPSYGGLAGSTLTMDRAVQNVRGWLDIPEEQIWAMATLNPARLLGLEKKGDITPGADADVVLWDQDGQAFSTWVGGKRVYVRADT